MEIFIQYYRKELNIPIQKILDYMNWANRSVLFKKENGTTKVTIEEALKLSILFKKPITKIFRLKVS